jgi:hypothetical protein
MALTFVTIVRLWVGTPCSWGRPHGVGGGELLSLLPSLPLYVLRNCLPTSVFTFDLTCLPPKRI